MLKIILLLILAPVIILNINGCSSSDQSTQNVNKDSVYVFDEIPPDTTSKIPEPKVESPNFPVKYYIIQIGAFTTKERADEFAAKSKNLIKENLDIEYGDNVKLYVVQLTPFYTSRNQAEKMRNSLWKMKQFKDAWIVTVTK